MPVLASKRRAISTLLYLNYVQVNSTIQTKVSLDLMEILWKNEFVKHGKRSMHLVQ
jgi:hypothetical protein